ncbi:MAG: twin-arginine translocase TatA/TatE family subunit [Propionibacteriaceae bacterium]|nr:twin-arginine translocase TatA/TatE family subunit [Propionibacteriaceae bacterium]
MFDFNAGEFVILAVLAVIIFGPDKLPELARKAARVWNFLRNIASDAKEQVRDGFGIDLNELEDMKTEVSAVAAQLKNEALAGAEQVTEIRAEAETLAKDANPTNT